MAKVDVGSEEYDSFTDLDFADVFLGGDVIRGTGWALLGTDAKGRGLASATRLLMRLQWCLVPAPLPTDAEVALVIQEATAMLAADLIAKPRLFSDASANSNVKTAKAGSAQVEFFRPVEGGPPLPGDVWAMLRNAGLVGCGDAEGVNVGAMASGVSDGCRPLGGTYPCDPDPRNWG
jgi:hypothetical protein